MRRWDRRFILFRSLLNTPMCLMRTWSLSLGLALICCTASVQAQSCFRDIDCTSGKCCPGGTCARWRCPCQSNDDCEFGEQCSTVLGVCYKTRPSFTVPPTIYIPTWDPITYNPVTFNPVNHCVWDNECSASETCEDGQCVYNYNQGSSGGFSWSGSKIVGIVLFVVVATIISCMYHLCKRARKPPNLPSRNVNLNSPPTGVVRVEGNDHEMQSGSAAATNSTVVEVENDAPLPPDAPPPYHSLEFESGQNGNRSFSEQPPPSYDEAVRNPAVP